MGGQMEGKTKIEKNSVQETLIVPLYGRKMCAEKFPELYRDTSAKELCEKLDYDFSDQEKKKDTVAYEFGALEAAMRQLDMMWEIQDYLCSHPEATLVNMGSGLDQTGRTCDNGSCQIFNVDYPDTISVRERLISPGPRERNLACDLMDFSWMDAIDPTRGVVFFAAGVFHYFKREDVKALVLELANRFPGARLVFDTVGKVGLKLMLTKVLKNMGINRVDGYFWAKNPAKELAWSSKIRVSSKGYMLGYFDMKSRGIRGIHRFLARIGDAMLHMKIVRMDFT